MFLTAWIRAARPLAQANIALPIVLGEALAYASSGRLHIPWLVAAHVFGVLDHLFIVFANDLADERADRDNPTPTPFSGGSRVLVLGLLSRRALGAGAGVALGGLVAWAVAVSLLGRPLGALFVLAAVALLWGYSYAPLRASYRGGGELLQGLGVGLVLPLLGWYLQTGGPPAVLAPSWMVPSFLCACAGNVITSLPDRAADARAEKRTLAVRLGASAAARVAVVALVIAAVLAMRSVDAPRPVAAVVLVAVGVLGSLGARQPIDRSRGAAMTAVLWLAGAQAALLVAWIAVLVLR